MIPERVQMGTSRVLNLEQTARLVTNFKDMATRGYSYTRQKVKDLASDCAYHLDIRSLVFVDSTCS